MIIINYLQVLQVIQGSEQMFIDFHYQVVFQVSVHNRGKENTLTGCYTHFNVQLRCFSNDLVSKWTLIIETSVYILLTSPLQLSGEETFGPRASVNCQKRSAHLKLAMASRRTMENRTFRYRRASVSRATAIR